MPNSQIKYSFIIPCYNEGRSLQILINEINSLLFRADIEFILVDNGSTDDTNELLNQFLNENIVKVSLLENAGYGGGIKAGLVKARGEFLGWIHADLQYSLTEVISHLNKIPSEVKYIKGKRRGRSIFQNFISLNMSIIESFLFKHVLYDINAQPTIFHKDLYKNLSNLPNDFSIDLYSYVVAKKTGAKISRFEVNFLKRKYGNSSWNTGFKSLVTMSVRTLKYSIDLRRNF
jgi:glycosyltransferase involved in cell wall biosynthesis